ncbi:MAG: hypothetical protein UW28_C0003G0023 [Parcubacteria group bacterium GW2011_GWA2_44_13]|nr:MAG: hypothetical protein UW28_C0003G0023 [Parcubacteria group bacterium GW2011_GWA2_44_13]
MAKQNDYFIASTAGLVTALFLMPVLLNLDALNAFYAIGVFVLIPVLGLSLFTGAVSGFIIGGVNAPGFIIASINSYFWNRLWVFPQTNGEGKFADFPKFALISILGVILNSLVVIYFTTYVHQFGFSDKVWLNAAKAIASAIVLTWNFVGYKFFAFK